MTPRQHDIARRLAAAHGHAWRTHPTGTTGQTGARRVACTSFARLEEQGCTTARIDAPGRVHHSPAAKQGRSIGWLVDRDGNTRITVHGAHGAPALSASLAGDTWSAVRAYGTYRKNDVHTLAHYIDAVGGFDFSSPDWRILAAQAHPDDRRRGATAYS